MKNSVSFSFCSYFKAYTPVYDLLRFTIILWLCKGNNTFSFWKGGLLRGCERGSERAELSHVSSIKSAWTRGIDRMRRYASGTKSHIAINAFSNAATVQRLSPARCKRSRRRAPRSSFPLSLSISSFPCPRSRAYVPGFPGCTDKCARAPAGFKLSVFHKWKTHMGLAELETFRFHILGRVPNGQSKCRPWANFEKLRQDDLRRLLGIA
jgi:hypothetical protein